MNIDFIQMLMYYLRVKPIVVCTKLEQNMQESFGATLMGNGFFSFNANGLMVVAGMQNSVFWGDDMDTTLMCVGRGDVTAIFGDGWNFAKGGRGNDTFIGGDGYNRLMGGGGDDLLVGGMGSNELAGGWGNDTIVFGQWDTALGGSGADVFTFVSKSDGEEEVIFETPPMPPTFPAGDTAIIPESFTYIGDFNVDEGDVLDLSMIDIDRSGVKVVEDALVCYTPEGVLYIEGVGIEITLMGGINAAVEAGSLWVNDFTGGGKG